MLEVSDRENNAETGKEKKKGQEGGKDERRNLSLHKTPFNSFSRALY